MRVTQKFILLFLYLVSVSTQVLSAMYFYESPTQLHKKDINRPNKNTHNLLLYKLVVESCVSYNLLTIKMNENFSLI